MRFGTVLTLIEQYKAARELIEEQYHHDSFVLKKREESGAISRSEYIRQQATLDTIYWQNDDQIAKQLVLYQEKLDRELKHD